MCRGRNQREGRREIGSLRRKNYLKSQRKRNTQSFQNTYGIHCNSVSFNIPVENFSPYYIINIHIIIQDEFTHLLLDYTLKSSSLLINFSNFHHTDIKPEGQSDSFYSISKHFTFIHLEIQILQSQTEANLKAIQPISNNPISPIYI